MTDLDDRAMDLFAEVERLSREQQDERLKLECAADPALGARVKELLSYHPEAERIAFLEPPPLPAVFGIAAGDQVPPDLPGYEVLRELGRGGMGVVWRVRDSVLRRSLAAKVPLDAYRDDPECRRRFLNEARVLGQLEHPGIVPIHQVGTLPDGRPFFVMKLVRGRRLDDLLTEKGPGAARWLRVFEAICQAVGYAHSQGIIHRDLKPSNVMLGKFGEVQVMDWGIAKILPGKTSLSAEVTQPYLPLDENEGQTSDRAVMGTWPYMPPEQANARIEEIDQRSDVFGLGAILCALLTGQPPYVGGSTEEVRRKAAKGDLADALTRLEACGADDLVALAKRCLAVDPEKRYADAREVAEEVANHRKNVETRAQQANEERVLAEVRAEAEEQARRHAEEARRLAEEKEQKATEIRILAEQRAEAEEQARRHAEEARRLAEEARRLAIVKEQEATENSIKERKARKRTLRLTAALACALVAVVVAGVLYLQAREARQQSDRAHLVSQMMRAEEKRQSTIDRALTAAMGGDLEAAEQAIVEAEQAGASAGQVRMLRGQIALHRGQSREAMGHLEEAVRLLPGSVAARGMLAAAYASVGRWELFDRTIREMEALTPSTPEDFLFKGYAEANLDPARGLRTMKEAFDRRPMMGVALLLRAEVRAFLGQDTDDLREAEGAVQDANYARELLRDNPAALWVSLSAHLAKAGVHEHRGEPARRRAELDLAGKYADALKPFTERQTLLPEAVVYRWLYFREMGSEEKVLDELLLASEQTDHLYVAFCYALTLYRRGRPGDFEKALRVLKKKSPSYNDRLRPFVLAEYDYSDKDKHGWLARVRKDSEAFQKWSNNDGLAVMDTSVMDAQAVLCLLGMKEAAVEASRTLLRQLRKERSSTLRSGPLLRCMRYNAGEITADKLVEDAGRSRWDQCLAHYYVGMRKLAEGDRDEAREHFAKVVETRAFIWGPYDFSWVFLARLEKDPAWPPWIPTRRAK
jgi:serine/threonine protein kinase